MAQLEAKSASSRCQPICLAEAWEISGLRRRKDSRDARNPSNSFHMGQPTFHDRHAALQVQDQLAEHPTKHDPLAEDCCKQGHQLKIRAHFCFRLAGQPP